MLIALAAAASAIVGADVTWRWVSDPPLALAGLLLVGLAVCLWMGFWWARPVGLIAAPSACSPR
jgi:ABC-type xylose transport system permease subunit